MRECRNLSCAETAKLVRAALKAAFPRTKFAVRSDTYSMGASIRVRWTDGPARAQVEAITDTFHGKTFDGMTDSSTYHRHMVAGELVNLGADYVFCSRDFGRATMERALDRACRRWGFDRSLYEIKASGGDHYATGPERQVDAPSRWFLSEVRALASRWTYELPATCTPWLRLPARAESA